MDHRQVGWRVYAFNTGQSFVSDYETAVMARTAHIPTMKI
jgi:hypothetical protein